MDYTFPKTRRLLHPQEYQHVLKNHKGRAPKGATFVVQYANQAGQFGVAGHAELGSAGQDEHSGARISAQADASVNKAADAQGAHPAPAKQEKTARLGLILSKKYVRRAVDRNRIKRAAREHFRQIAEKLSPSDYVLRVAQKIPAHVHSARQQKVFLRAQMQTLFPLPRLPLATSS